MKKFMFLFLVVAFVAMMAVGAMATDCCGPCPPVCDGDTQLDLNWIIYGLHCIDIDTQCIDLCGWVPCPGNVMESCCNEFYYTLTNTGCPGTVYAWLDSHIYGADVYVDLDGCPVCLDPGEIEAGEASAVPIYTTAKNECRTGTGGIMMKVFPVANCGSGTAYLNFKIVADQPQPNPCP